MPKPMTLPLHGRQGVAVARDPPGHAMGYQTDRLSGAARRSQGHRIGRDQTDAFETELAAIQSLYASSQVNSVRRSRAQARTGGALASGPAPVGLGAGGSQIAPGDSPLGSLVEQASQLRDAIAGFIQMMPPTPPLPVAVQGARHTAEFASSPSSAADRGTNRGGLSAAEVAELAALRTLTAAESADLSNVPAQKDDFTQTVSVRSSQPQVQSGYPATNISGETDQAAGDENVPAAINAAPRQDTLPLQKGADAGPPSSDTAEPADVVCDGHVRAHVSALQRIRIPYEAVAALEEGGAPQLWTSFRMPGAKEERTWHLLGALGDLELTRTPGEGFCVPAMQPDNTAQVMLTHTWCS